MEPEFHSETLFNGLQFIRNLEAISQTRFHKATGSVTQLSTHISIETPSEKKMIFVIFVRTFGRDEAWRAWI